MSLSDLLLTKLVAAGLSGVGRSAGDGLTAADMVWSCGNDHGCRLPAQCISSNDTGIKMEIASFVRVRGPLSLRREAMRNVFV